MAKGPEKTKAALPDEAPLPAGAVLPFGSKPLRTFVLALGMPAFLFYVLSACLVIAALQLMSSDINRLEDNRGITAIHAALDSFLNDLSNSVSDEGTWNEAYLNVVVNSDPAWMDTTWGATARIGLNYDNVLVTDQTGTIIFGENNLGAIKGNIATRFPSTRTMLHELDAGILATGDATTISRFGADTDGTAGIAAISIHQTTPGLMSVPRDTRRVLWLIKHLSPTLLQDISVRYQTPLAQMTKSVEPDDSSIDLADADGKPAGTLAWTPDRPGDIAFNHAILIASFIFFGIGLVLVLGLGLLRRRMLKRSAAIIAAYHAVAQSVAPAEPAKAGKKKAAAAEVDDDDDNLDLSNPIEGVSAGDFDIEYQPIFDLRAESLIGVDAVLRWRRPDKTILAQEELAPAQHAALLQRVGILAIRRATDEIAPLIGLMLTVAISPVQLQNPVFAEKIAGTLGATNFPARRLQLAVNAALLPNADALRTGIAPLRHSGVLIAVNDFTIGAATFDYVDNTLIDRVRLAPASVAGIDRSPARHAFVAASIEAARAANLAVTAPGSTRKEEVSKLLRLGCREFQGDIFAKPMPVAALTQLILAPAVRKAS